VATLESIGWLILASSVFLFIVYAYISSKISDRNRRQRQTECLPDAQAPLVAGRTYNIQLSHGRKIDNVTVVGISDDSEADAWRNEMWIVVRGKDDKHRYLRYNSIRYVEDA
tara:strand:- start:1573 stop:1908 length:336 start_codon:yes stop_codon:yes gene_type:complete